MNNLRTSEEKLYYAVYKPSKPIKDIEPLYEDNEVHKFFTKVEHRENTIDDVQEIRYWKNKLVTIRDKYEHGGTMWTMFNNELKRVVEFLEGFI